MWRAIDAAPRERQTPASLSLACPPRRLSDPGTLAAKRCLTTPQTADVDRPTRRWQTSAAPTSPRITLAVTLGSRCQPGARVVGRRRTRRCRPLSRMAPRQPRTTSPRAPQKSRSRSALPSSMPEPLPASPFSTLSKPPLPPILRWAGSKRQLLPALIRLAPTEYGRYIEPFTGSASLFFALRPRHAILGDINYELIDTYHAIRSHPRLVHRGVVALPPHMTNYYRVRRLTPDSLDSIRRAVRFVYLNRLCFNGVYRTNRSNHFNVPRGRSTGGFPNLSAFLRVAAALRTAYLVAADFETTARYARAKDFVYLDPPYDTRTRPRYGEYGYGTFLHTDLGRLIEVMKVLDRRGARVLLSYADVPFLRRPRPGWHARRLTARRHVAGFARHRHNVRELLLANYPLPELP